MHVEILREKANGLDLPRYVLETIEYELSSLEKVQSGSAEYTIITNYIGWVLSLPWSTSSDKTIDLPRAREMLDEDLLGLATAKQKVLEYIAIACGSSDSVLPVLCLTGPPGMGKATLSRSIARAMGREFVRISMESIRDKHEIAGEWRTCVGNRPGLIIRGLRQCGQNDPVIMIDGIDCRMSDSDSDLTTALLDVLHPEKNPSFHDRYLNLTFDLSNVFFVTTANAPNSIPSEFRNMVEVISLPGYTDNNKLKIARKSIVPRRLREVGIDDGRVRIHDSALQEVVRAYTYEAGVYQLDKRIGTICRKLVKRLLETNSATAEVDDSTVKELLGSPVIKPEMINRLPEVGISTALNLSRAGGTVMFVEATRMVGSGAVRITGSPPRQVRELVEESLSYVKSHADKLEIPLERILGSDIHIHFPEGITQSDCRSLGLSVIVVLASLFTEMPIHHDFAFCGEITLRGRVNPTGGIEEKAFAANRSGIRKVFLSAHNKREVDRLPRELVSDTEFVFVNTVEEAIEQALMKIIIPSKNLDQSLDSITKTQQNGSNSA